MDKSQKIQIVINFLAAVQNIGIYSVGRCTYETGFKNFTFADGAPFGIKVG